jgi:predicted dehydrogenase
LLYETGSPARRQVRRRARFDRAINTVGTASGKRGRRHGKIRSRIVSNTPKPVKIGIIGCGNISGIYFKAGKTFSILDIVACADLDLERARAKAEEHGILKACTVQDLLADPEIEIVVNLTIPNAHYDVCLAALNAGKNVHVEKPLSITREQGRHLLETAKAKGLRVGAAPDTFLGGGLQTCRKLIDDGWIGEPIGATAFMLCHGHESWHPDPEFYYKVGGGPMFDMGPYYLTALISLIGPIRRVTGSTRVTFPERTITSAPKYGTKVAVDVPTHVAGIMDFQNGAVGTILTSFDVWSSKLPCIEIYGTEGSMQVPDPNGFGGPVQVRRPGAKDWTEMPLTHGFSENSRGIGVADMAYAIQSGRAHRANGALAYHVLETMHGFHDASNEGKHYEMHSTVERPAPLPLGLPKDALDV